MWLLRGGTSLTALVANPVISATYTIVQLGTTAAGSCTFSVAGTDSSNPKITASTDVTVTVE